jgi:hypothetical protein
LEFQSDIAVLMDCQRGPAWQHLAIAPSAKTQGLIVIRICGIELGKFGLAKSIGHAAIERAGSRK